ncbi:Protoporphyrinogen oxidase [Vibrio nigripulchritudo SFn27]|uniref:Protoporphyrinogen IX dehydrogenase [quinone] n=1 Tax=Vibrio nigripulchritudo TaxID=28173 RepID=U4KC44_9VIBR|nr:menaquinone-dependent protoporphyrinogen IX dehydrogenase [Vibrio nigripulchritudo]CCN85360.1 Protoporphyrinogen oxidase [Vibrio nigripulchritudo BLFn1]CCN89068.1 Protoporphyrinogen oxidase [Vibrio nigripulchritudo SFn27]CCN95145.1 Protoporphyrinogen oxidase [Vibrio nigripulchritudo ENn2]CCO41807.1 Protoporphyrinogen oxidase [Vibrio nigripulchritudo SFn135]CCO50873.1 Protoporphyrinogen oxidase [Vibrio nigripulchritudo Wn13]
MEKVLLLHSSREGQTIKILHYIEEKLGSVDCTMMDLHQIETVNLSGYDKVVIGASIRYGHLNKKLYQFIDRHLEALNQANAAFFCVNLTARKEAEGKDTPEGSAYIRKFLTKSPWKPSLIGVFAGALYYPRYRWFDRVMIRFIMKMTGGETDTTKEVEYTNWEKVSLFVDSVKNLSK